MKNIMPYFIMVLTAAMTPAVSAQIDSLRQDDVLDMLLNQLENDADEEVAVNEEVLEEMQEGVVHGKVNLNALSYEVAVRRFQLSEYQYYQLQLYMEKYGQLVSIYELAAIEGFTQEDITRLTPFVSAVPLPDKQEFFKDFFSKSRTSFFARYGQILEKQAGYDTSRGSHYDGSPGHACFRLNFETQNRLFFKFAGEKDAGECFFRGKQRQGFDLYSGSLSVKRMGIVSRAVVGDYRLNLGQGLVLGSSLLSGKGGGVAAIRRFSTGIRAVALTNESDALRGGAITLGTARYSGTLFAGRQLGTLQNSAGADFGCRYRNFSLGARVVARSTTDTSSTQTVWQSSFHPTALNAAIDYHAIIRRVIAAGEIAINGHARIALLQSFIFNVTPTSRFAVVLRHYDKYYSAPLGRALGSTANNAGETGIYLVNSTILGHRCTFDLYGDYYRLTWLSYRTDAPVSCIDAGAALHLDLSRSSSLHLRYYWKSKPENDPKLVHEKQLHEHDRHRIRLQWTNNPLESLNLKTEVAWLCNHYPMRQEHYSGLLLYQDAAWSFRKPDLVVHLRIAYFDTDRYDERLYAYEDDLYYAFTIGSYYYKGVRGYIVLRYKYQWISVWLRLSQTFYIDRNSIGSGLTYIDKPHKTELKIQVMFSF